ncbi:helix-turn-helix transcriptional regulator [Lipingzhangella sp. LS1_29]|uniref:Helix-turn-helix transcriptional regulator n=1 Tax=Lipingzhangella rawalii TaxID=2055835 RepID=A0ABU2H629_9ACTN|nr:helix-turn-helix transcriptional regulator [Lipingzhangella rawalii]MDS1270761.1 helix-turn-helix transcriptional regulator [Lipingzhangella rawalii]
MSDNRAKRRFGSELARMRKRQGVTQESLARILGVSGSHVSNLERGHREPTLAFLPSLDTALATGDLFQRLWDELTGNGRPAWLAEIATAIKRADAVYEFSTMAFPSYLQKEAYAYALVRYAAPWLTPDEVNTRVAERVERADHMERALRPKLWLVIDEPLLKRRYGGVGAVREQLAHIARLAEEERITLQVIPTETEKHPGNSGPFRVLVTRNSPDVMYAESARAGHTITDPTEVANHRMLFADLQGVATSPSAALQTLYEEIQRIDNA